MKTLEYLIILLSKYNQNDYVYNLKFILEASNFSN